MPLFPFNIALLDDERVFSQDLGRHLLDDWPSRHGTTNVSSGIQASRYLTLHNATESTPR
jgi:hypothetical protein